MEFREAAVEALKLLERAGADQAQVGALDYRGRLVKFADDAVTQTWADTRHVINCLVIAGKRVATASVNGLSKSSVEKLTRKVMKIAKVSEPNPDFNSLIAPKPIKYVEGLFDPSISELSIQDMVSMVNNCFQAAHEEHRTVTGSSGGLLTSSMETIILNNLGVDAEEKESDISFYITVTAKKNSEETESASGTISKQVENFNPVQKTREAAKLAAMQFKPKNIDAGEYKVIFDPLATAILFWGYPLASVFSARSVEEGATFLADKIGQKVASEKVTVQDACHDPNIRGARSFDGEGHPTIEKTLINKGVFKSFVHDSYTAGKTSEEPTGNATLEIDPIERGLGFIGGLGKPIPLALKFLGCEDREELIRGVDDGLLIHGLWYAKAVNKVAGNWTATTRNGAFLIKKGSIVYPLKKFRVYDSLPSLLSKVDGVANDYQNSLFWDRYGYTSTISTSINVLGKP